MAIQANMLSIYCASMSYTMSCATYTNRFHNTEISIGNTEVHCPAAENWICYPLQYRVALTHHQMLDNHSGCPRRYPDGPSTHRIPSGCLFARLSEYTRRRLLFE